MIEPITISGTTFDVKEVSSLCFNRGNQELRVYQTTGGMIVIYCCSIDQYRHLLSRVDRTRTLIQEFVPAEGMMTVHTFQYWDDSEESDQSLNPIALLSGLLRAKP